jgi:hypothetical protein
MSCWSHSRSNIGLDRSGSVLRQVAELDAVVGQRYADLVGKGPELGDDLLVDAVALGQSALMLA